MFWADKIAKKIIDSGKYSPYWVDDMKTPSGRIHVGSLRGVVIHDLLYKTLLYRGKKATYTYCINDMDPMDGFPVYLDRQKFYKYMGHPLFKIPSPESGFSSFSEYFAKEFIDVFNKINCFPQIVWTSDLYQEGKFDNLIKTYLDNTEKIRQLFKEQYKNFKEEGYYPYQPICPSCGKIATTRIYKWDGSFVYFECKKEAVDYTNGCGFRGKIKPRKQNGKLPWKIEWSAHWKTLGVTIEWSGKDHMTAGGSHEIASRVCEVILNYPTPYAESYEHLLIGGKKMSSSKGLGSSAKEVSDILPPYLLRFLFVRTDYRQAIEFDPIGTMSIPNLFDEYDRCWKAYNIDGDKDLTRVFELSQIDKIPPKQKDLFIPRFRDVVNFVQQVSENQIQSKFEQKIDRKLTVEEQEILKERINYANPWIEKYAPEEFRFKLDAIKTTGEIALTEKQKEYLNNIIPLLDIYNNVEELNLALYNKAKETNLDSKEAFKAIYLSLLGKSHGPKAAWLLLSSSKNEVVKRLELAAGLKDTSEVSQRDSSDGGGIKTINHPDIFTIDPQLKAKYPSISIGIAIIKGIKVDKSNPELEKEKEEFLKSIEGLTTEELGKLPEIISYRKLYKEMGIDWHSRRPSPEALLRRVALKKGLYTINTCVDAYNLIVMKYRVSVGTFDLDQMELPTVLRHAKLGEEIHLLGDEKPTPYTEKELAYFDQKGGFNIDFNYRDAIRTVVTLDTKNIILNLDGIYDATPEKVQRSLDETISIIQKYCGGTLEVKGVII